MKKIIISASILLSSCTFRLVDFTAISTKNITVSKANGVQTKGKSVKFLGISANVKDATDKALNNAGKDYDMLIDGVIRYVRYPFVRGYKVEGVAIKTGK
jgi:hypothetical protein